MFHLYVFIYLLLAHLLADFIFQTDALVAWKQKSWKGVFVHSLILFAVSLALFWPFWLEGASGSRLGSFWENMNLWGIAILLLNAGLHFLMDSDKIRKEKKNHQYVKMFFVDQFFHVAVIAVMTLAIGYLYTFSYSTGLYALYTRCGADSTCGLMTFFTEFLPLALYLIAAILSTSVYEIVKYQFARQLGTHSRMKFDYKKMFVRLIVLSLIFAFFMFFWGPHIAMTFWK